MSATREVLARILRDAMEHKNWQEHTLDRIEPLLSSASEPETARRIAGDEAALRHVRAMASDLFDNRLGWSDGQNPYAPRELWWALGAALYGENDPRVEELRGLAQESAPPPAAEFYKFCPFCQGEAPGCPACEPASPAPGDGDTAPINLRRTLVDHAACGMFETMDHPAHLDCQKADAAAEALVTEFERATVEAQAARMEKAREILGISETYNAMIGYAELIPMVVDDEERVGEMCDRIRKCGEQLRSDLQEARDLLGKSPVGDEGGTA